MKLRIVLIISLFPVLAYSQTRTDGRLQFEPVTNTWHFFVNGVDVLAGASTTTVAKLPASTTKGAQAVVVDGASSSDCSTGGGSTIVQCLYNGSSWINTVSMPLQGTDPNILTSGTVSGTASPLCTDALGGATTVGCPSTSGGVSGTAGQSTFFSGTNAVTGGAGEIDMKGLSGADLGAIMNNCTGKVCKADNLTGSLTLSTPVTVPVGVTFHFCGQSISQSAAVTLSNAEGSIIGCPGASTTFTKAGNIDQFTMSASNTHVRGLTLAGAAGSFTGGGINASSAGVGSDVEDNAISNEQTFAIKPGGSVLTFNNTVTASTSSTQAAITGGGKIVHNTVNTNGPIDGIDATATGTVVDGNTSNIAPPASTSGLCAINVLGDVIAVEVTNNSTNDADSNSGNTNYGICLTTSGGSSHMYENNVEHNSFNGQATGGASAIGFWLNNATSLATEFSENHFRDNTCTHETQCFKMTDSTNQPNYGEEFAFNNGGIIGSDTGFVLKQITNAATPGFSLAQINAFTVGPGSQVWCHDCAVGRPAITGGPGNLLTLDGNGVWVGVPKNTWAVVQSNSATANASSSAVTLGSYTVPGDLIVVSAYCLTGGGVPTFSTSDGTNTYTSSIAFQAAPTNSSGVQIFHFPATGAKTITVTSSVNVCIASFGVTVVEYSGLLTSSPLDGAGASAQGNSTALASGGFSCTTGDLVFGIGGDAATGLSSPGAGFTLRGNPNNATLTEDQTCGSAGTANVVMTGASGNWATSGVAFKRAP